MARTTGVIIVLNGFPGTSKLTILTQLKKLLPPNSTFLLDNHLLIDPVAAVIPDRNNEHHQLRGSVRKSVFQKLRSLAQEGYIILMTACLAANNKQDTAFLEEHLDITRGTDVPIFWINVHCDEKALEHRLSSPERCHGTKTKPNRCEHPSRIATEVLPYFTNKYCRPIDETSCEKLGCERVSRDVSQEFNRHDWSLRRHQL